MDAIQIEYIFTFPRNRKEVVTCRFDPETFTLLDQPAAAMPDWARLEYHQCPHCPLKPADHPWCPAAASIVDVVKRFDGVMSYDKIFIEVITHDRKCTQHTTAQKAISSLLGLIFPASGCPLTAFFRPMARFHLPLSTVPDTVFRATGMYLLAQYFLACDGGRGTLDLQGLTRIYQDMHELNVSICERLKTATRTDSSSNALVVLDVFTHTLPFAIKDQLDMLRPLFKAYFPESS